MATEILKKQTIVGTDAQYEANRNSYGEGTVFESTSLLGENDIDPTYTNKFVQKRTTTGGVYLYAYDSTGDISQSADTGANAYTVARRDAGGVLNVGDPTSQYHAVNKKYVDDGFVPKTSRIGIVYCTDNKGNQARINYSENNAAWTIAQRDGSGHVRTADPEGQNDATNKKYVDDNFVPKTTTARRVYATDDAGNQKPVNYTHEISANSMMIRDGSGRAKIQTPLVADQIANKRYVDDNFISKYINGGIVYANDTSGSQTGIEYSETADKGTIAIRDESGHVRTADPVGQNDAVNKAYVDSRFRYTHFIQVEFAPVPDYIACKGTIIYVSNSSTPITNINELPLNVTLYMNGLYADYPGVVYNAKRISESGVEVGLMQDSNGISSNETVTMTFTIITDTVL